MEGVRQLQLCQQRLAVVTNAMCRSETWPETTENAGGEIEKLGRRKQA